MTGEFGRSVGAQALSVALVAGLLALLVWKVAHQVGDATIASDVHKGKEPATPAFDLPRLDGGGTLASASLHGKPQVVNFWASWCDPVPRRGAAPAGRASQRYARTARRRSASTTRTSAATRAASSRRYGLTYPSVVDKGDELYARYGLTRRARDVLRRPQRARRRARARRRDEGDAAAVHPGRALRVAARRRCRARARAAPAVASEQHPTQGELEGEVDLPDLPHDARPVELADRAAHEGVHRAADRAPATRRSRDRATSSSRTFGPAVVATPATHGFDLLAWLLPLVGCCSPARSCVGAAAWRWSRAARRAARRRAAAAARSRARAARRRRARALRGLEAVAGRIPLAFLAGFASFVAPCVLPLVPGYLPRYLARASSSDVPARRDASSRACRSSPASPVVFVALGVSSAALVGHRRPARVRGDRRLRARRVRARVRASPAAAGAPRRAAACSPPRAAAARACCSAARSPSAPRRASSPILARRSCSPADSSTVARGRAAPALRLLARPRRAVRRSRASSSCPRWDRSAGSATATTTSRSSAGSSSSCSGCCSSSTSSGGCAPAFDRTSVLDARRRELERAGGDARRRARPASSTAATSTPRCAGANGPSRRAAFSSCRSQPYGCRGRLVPGDRDVDEPLVEVALLGRRRAPRELELLVRGEELSAPDQLEAALEVQPRFEHRARH